MKKFVPIVIISFLIFTACKSKQETTPEQSNKDTIVSSEMQTEQNDSPLAVKNAVGGYGKEITADGAIDIKQLVLDTKKANGYTGKISGTIDACCQRKGCWMKMETGEGKTIMITFKDYGFFVPMDIPGKEVVLEGIAQMDTVSVEEQKHLAMDAGKSEKEIAAISKPSLELVFVADGVILK